MPDQSPLLERLLVATRPSEVQAILTELGDHAERGIRSPFGVSQFMWEPYNGNENNLGTINLGSNSGRSLTERITNSIDATAFRSESPHIPPTKHIHRKARQFH